MIRNYIIVLRNYFNKIGTNDIVLGRWSLNNKDINMMYGHIDNCYLSLKDNQIQN